jgi:hypothetical protein
MGENLISQHHFAHSFFLFNIFFTVLGEILLFSRFTLDFSFLRAIYAGSCHFRPFSCILTDFLSTNG